MLPTIHNYGRYSSDNYGAHTLKVNMPGLSVWFSYETPVAFATNTVFVIRENEWGPATGKHLNWIDTGTTKRVTTEKFEQMWRTHVLKVENGLFEDLPCKK